MKNIIMKKNGFTLIELLTVIAIIGILSSIVVASMTSARQKARDTKRVSDIKQLQLALATYADANSNHYPATLDLLAPTYIPTIPVPPGGTRQTTYSSLYNAFSSVPNSTPCISYHLGAVLEVSGNPALLDDGSDPSALDSLCAGNANSSDFSGSDTGPCGLSGTGYCFDVKP